MQRRAGHPVVVLAIVIGMGNLVLFLHWQRGRGVGVNGRYDHARAMLLAAPAALLNETYLALPCPARVRAEELLYTPEGHRHAPSAALDDDGLAPLTRWVQEEIERRMHPPDCARARFLLTEGWPHGIGSTVHVIGTHLAHAIENGLVLDWGPASCVNFLDARECSGIGVGCGCLFLRITDCPAEVVRANAVGVIQGVDYQHVVPDVFRRAVQRAVPNMQEREILFWWRGQSAGYLARFNNATLSAVRALRVRDGVHYYYAGGRGQPLPFPLPAGAVNAHIRHGDKHTEMKLVESERYFEAAQRLARHQPFSLGGRAYFVSSDDGDAIEANRRLAEGAGWGFVYSRLERMRGGFNSEAWAGMAGSVRLPTLYAQLQQLLMSLEADAWVGTRASNGNRLIDELRCVWVDKCRQVYVDVGFLGELEYAW
jgi:hypothetical protein